MNMYEILQNEHCYENEDMELEILRRICQASWVNRGRATQQGGGAVRTKGVVKLQERESSKREDDEISIRR